MASAQTIVTRSLRLIGQVASGSSPKAAESADGLVALNAFVESLRNEGLTAYARQELSLTTSTVVSRTIGPTGDLVTVRPVAIERAWVLVDDVSHEVKLLPNRDAYSAIPNKTLTGDWPTHAFYEPTMPDGTIYFYTVPNTSRTMKLQTVVPVTEFASLATTIALPPGWEQMLAFNLACLLAPEFETEAPPKVEREAARSLGAIKSRNSKTIIAKTELAAMLGNNAHSNILTGP